MMISIIRCSDARILRTQPRTVWKHQVLLVFFGLFLFSWQINYKYNFATLLFNLIVIFFVILFFFFKDKEIFS